MSEATYSEDEQKTVKFITERLFADAKKWKFFYSGDKQVGWVDDCKWYKGMQWSLKRSKEKSSIFFNRLFSTIQKELPFMTDRQPKIFVKAQEPSDNFSAKIFEQIVAQAWLDRDMMRKLPLAVLFAKQTGKGFLRPFWNDKLANGLGDVDCEVVDPLEVFPFAYTSDLTTCQGVIWARWVSLGNIRQQFPKDGWRVKVEGNVESGVPDRAKDTNTTSAFTYAQVTDTTAAETHYLPSPGGSSLSESDLKRVLLITAFLKDGSLEDYEEEDKKGVKLKKQRFAYPNGRAITIAGGVVLEDEPFPFKNFPGIVAFSNYDNPGEFWGISDITQIKEGQKELNKLQAMIIDAVKRDVYKQKFINSASGIDIDTFTVTSDSVYETNVPNPVQETGQFSIPPAVFNYSEQIEKAIQTTAGTAEYSPPAGGDLPSGRSFQQFQEITQTRLREKLRNMEAAIRHVGKMWLEMILANYTEQRVARLVNPNNKEDEYVFIFREENPEQAEYIRGKAEVEIIPGTEAKDLMTGMVIPGTGDKKYMHILNLADVSIDFDLIVATASTISTSQLASFEQAISLFDRGAIDQQALLEAADYPNKEEIMERMEKKAQEMAQQQMQQAQQMQQMQVAGTVKKPQFAGGIR